MHHRVFRLIAAFSCLALCGPATAADAPGISLTVDTGRPVGQIDERIYGHFLEHIYHSCNGGLWGETVWNRSFEEACSGDPWFVRGGSLVSPEELKNKTESQFPVGDGAWTDYTFSVKARRSSAKGELLFAVRDDHGRATLVLGDGPEGVQLLHSAMNWQVGKEETAVLAKRPGKIETARWCSVRIECKGTHVKAWLDDELLAECNVKGLQSNGPASVGVRQAQAEFRDFKVTAPGGRELFAGLPSPARHWCAIGDGKISLDRDQPLNGRQCIKIENAADQSSGIEQRGFCIHQGDVYHGSLWARGECPELVVKLAGDEKAAGAKNIGEKTSDEKAIVLPTLHSSADWKEYPLEFRPAKSCDNAVLQIALTGEGKLWLDQVSLMPDSARATGGFRPDLLAAVQELHPPIIRWPGGSFVDGYKWKEGIGPQKNRIGKPGWDDYDPLAFGLDEFISLCRKVGSEPLIAVNVEPDKPELVQDACDLIEYCNGPADSTWGRKRAENGHPEPYHVKLFEIGNEKWGFSPKTYARVVQQFVPRMKKADPSIQTIGCGSGGMGEHGIGQDWNRVVIDRAAPLMDYLSIHQYESPENFADGPRKYLDFCRAAGRLIAASKNPRVKLFVSEWNAQSTDWRTGLYCGGLLNGFERNSDLVAMASPALFLRHVSAPSWDNAFINFDQCGWFPAPNYVVMKLYRDHYAPQRLAVSGDAGPLSVVATRSTDGKRLVLKAVNATDRAVPLRVKLDGPFNMGKAAHWKLEVVAPDQLAARNTLQQPHAVHSVEAPIDAHASELQFTLPRWSVTVAEGTP